MSAKPPGDDGAARPREMETTGSLARGAREGDQERLGRLFTRLAPALYAWARLRIRAGFRATLSPEDLVQEVWVRALEVFPSFEPTRCSFRTWLFAVAKHVLFEAQRRLARRAPVQPAGGGTTRLGRLHELPAEITDVTRRVARDEAVQAFQERIAKLEDLDRKLVLHCGFEELPNREVAERLGMEVEAVKKRWQRLRARLREWNVPDELLAE